MMPVTDPGLINQLESSAQQPQPVSDPNLIAQLEQQSQSQQPSTLQTMAHSPFVNGVLGMGDAIRNSLKNLYDVAPKPFIDFTNPNLVKPNINYSQAETALNKPAAPLAPSSSGLAYDIGNFGGNVATFAPMVMAAGPSKTGQALAGAAYGAINNPDNRLIGAAIGAGSAVIPPALISGGAKLFNAIRPQKYAESIISDLSGGRSLEQNAQSLAQDVQNALSQNKTIGKNNFNKVLDQYGDNKIYNKVDPIYGVSQVGDYENIPNLSSQMPSDLRDIHNNFLNNPTLDNAHKLQSMLGSEIGDLNYANSKGLLNPDQKSNISLFTNARNTLLGDIKSYLSSQDLGAAGNYIGAQNYWRDNVGPYFSNPKLSQIANGEITNPNNIANLFKNPEPEIQKVVDDLGDAAKNKILYSQLGKLKGTLTPESLVNGINNLDAQGLGSYATPTLSDQLKTLTSRLANRNFIPWSEKFANAYRFAGSKDSINKVGSGLSSSVGAAYPYISQETIANMLNQYFNGRPQ